MSQESDRLLSSQLVSLGLTHAEAEIALSLVYGLTPREIASKRRVSIHTIRNQLKSAMSKTGSRRQSDLVLIVERARTPPVK